MSSPLFRPMIPSWLARVSMLISGLIALAPVALSAPPTPSSAPLLSPTTTWLTEQEPQWQSAYQSEVMAPFEKAVIELKKEYLAALETGFATATRAARLTDAVGFRSERDRVNGGADVPTEDDPNDPTALKTLRANYRKKLATLEAQRLTNAKAVFKRIDALLAQNQALLTQRQRVDEALELKAKREQLSAAWLQSPAGSGTSSAAATSGAPKNSPVAATREKPFENSLGMKFVPVPITGGPTKGQRVFFGVWEVRVQDYEAFAKETNRDWPRTSFAQGPAHPAVNVTWDDAQAFCAWLTERDRTAGQIGAKDWYRLPSDHEWSCAVEIADREDPARLPALKDMQVADIFPWGNRWPPLSQAGNFSGEETVGNAVSSSQKALPGYRDEFTQTAPVGSFAANRFGLYDLAGNVWEWCEDWFDAQQQGHVLRGGSWHDGVRDRLLASKRGSDPAGNRNAWNGFRCVLSLAGKGS